MIAYEYGVETIDVGPRRHRVRWPDGYESPQEFCNNCGFAYPQGSAPDLLCVGCDL